MRRNILRQGTAIAMAVLLAVPALHVRAVGAELEMEAENTVPTIWVNADDAYGSTAAGYESVGGGGKT